MSRNIHRSCALSVENDEMREETHGENDAFNQLLPP